MPDLKSLRLAFSEFLGDDRYRKFISQGFKPHLRYWQEKEWHNFVSANPEFDIPLADLEVALRICEIHGLDLQSEKAVLFHGSIDYAPDFPDRSNHYPHAADRLISTEGLSPENFPTVVWYCSECRTALELLSRVSS